MRPRRSKVIYGILRSANSENIILWITITRASRKKPRSYTGVGDFHKRQRSNEPRTAPTNTT